ncbi:hypothetical protein FBUS_00604 [Fasciolopsis buskii]|uniref:Uncharacterized protein n=1 Tax=Fasciolopsis buskii TaxID=27845 RepID=A0A8E0RS43_9TREM|nr:hypothetical protein FBUS_00604 [Fasciolopsis buski]
MRASGSNLLRPKDDSHSNLLGQVVEESAPQAPSWQQRKRDKRGDVGESGADSSSRDTASTNGAGDRNPTDLMANSVAPVVHVAEHHQHTCDSGYESTVACLSASDAAYQYPFPAGQHTPHSNQPFG